MCGHSGRKCPCVTERFTPVESVQCSQVEPYHGCWHMKTATFWWGGGPEALIWRPPPRFQSHHLDLAASGLDCRNKPQRRTASTYKYRQGWAGAGPNSKLIATNWLNRRKPDIYWPRGDRPPAQRKTGTFFGRSTKCPIVNRVTAQQGGDFIDSMLTPLSDGPPTPKST